MRRDGVVVITDFAQLIAPINMRADGTYVGYTVVWTGSSVDLIMPGIDTCNDWTDETTSFSAASGIANYANTTGFRLLVPTCNVTTQPIYCLSI